MLYIQDFYSPRDFLSGLIFFIDRENVCRFSFLIFSSGTTSGSVRKAGLRYHILNVNVKMRHLRQIAGIAANVVRSNFPLFLDATEKTWVTRCPFF